MLAGVALLAKRDGLVLIERDAWRREARHKCRLVTRFTVVLISFYIVLVIVCAVDPSFLFMKNLIAYKIVSLVIQKFISWT